MALKRAQHAALLALVGAALVALTLVTWHWVAPRWSPLGCLLPIDAYPAIPRPTRPRTLDSAQFSGRIATAYRTAKERPALLERMPCYCGCYLTQGHQNNLDCFRDQRAAGDEMCVAIAQRARELEDDGYSVADVKALIDRAFAPRGRQP
jgi:hypothetical protein